MIWERLIWAEKNQKEIWKEIEKVEQEVTLRSIQEN
jgi:hypothetical protein